MLLKYNYNIKINRQEVVDAISKMIIIVNKKSPQQSITNVMLSFQENKLIIRTTNMEVFLESVILLKESVEKCDIFLKAHLFLDILKKTKIDEINIGIENNKIILHCDKAVFTFPHVSHNFPTINRNNEKDGPSFILNDDLFSIFINVDNKHSGGTLLEYIDHKIRCSFFDRRRISFYYIETISKNHLSTFLLNPKYFREIKKFFKIGSVIKISYTDNNITFQSDITITFLKQTQNMIDVSSLLRNIQDYTEGRFSKKEILMSLEKILLTSSPITRSIKLDFKDNLEITSFDPVLGKGIDLIENNSNIRGVISLNGDFLLEILKLIPDNTVKILYHSTMRPFFICGLSTHLIMPIRF